MDSTYDPGGYIDLMHTHDKFFKRLSQTEQISFLSNIDVMTCHDYLIEIYGGLSGIRDENEIDYITEVIRVDYARKEHLYEAAFEYLWYIVRNHPFNDANKRTGIMCMMWFLENNGETWRGNLGQLEQQVIGIASRKVEYEDMFLAFLRVSGWNLPDDTPYGSFFA
jgi:death-on-curing protein